MDTLKILEGMRKVSQAAILAERKSLETLEASVQEFCRQGRNTKKFDSTMSGCRKRTARNIKFHEKQLVWIDKEEKKYRKQP